MWRGSGVRAAAMLPFLLGTWQEHEQPMPEDSQQRSEPRVGTCGSKETAVGRWEGLHEWVLMGPCHKAMHCGVQQKVNTLTVNSFQLPLLHPLKLRDIVEHDEVVPVSQNQGRSPRPTSPDLRLYCT